MRSIEELLSGNIPRDQMTPDEERVFLDYWYETYEKAGFTKAYQTPYTQHANRIGMPFEVVGRLTEKDTDIGCLPMWNIRFADGVTIAAPAEEITLLELNDQPADMYLRNPSYPCSAEELLEEITSDIPCSFCAKAVTDNGVTFACAKEVAAKLIADIGNGEHIKVACEGNYEDLCSRYFRIAQKGELAVVAKLILRVAAPGHNENAYYELHVIDDISDSGCTLEQVEDMTELAVKAQLETYMRSVLQKLSRLTVKEISTPAKFLVQCREPDGTVTYGLYTEQQVINLHGFRDCSNCEYEVFDVRHFGIAIRLQEFRDSLGEPNYHRFCYPKQLGGEIVISGYSSEH